MRFLLVTFDFFGKLYHEVVHLSKIVQGSDLCDKNKNIHLF